MVGLWRDEVMSLWRDEVVGCGGMRCNAACTQSPQVVNYDVCVCLWVCVWVLVCVCVGVTLYTLCTVLFLAVETLPVFSVSVVLECVVELCVVFVHVYSLLLCVYSSRTMGSTSVLSYCI